MVGEEGEAGAETGDFIQDALIRLRVPHFELTDAGLEAGQPPFTLPPQREREPFGGRWRWWSGAWNRTGGGGEKPPVKQLRLGRRVVHGRKKTARQGRAGNRSAFGERLKSVHFSPLVHFSLKFEGSGGSGQKWTDLPVAIFAAIAPEGACAAAYTGAKWIRVARGTGPAGVPPEALTDARTGESPGPRDSVSNRARAGSFSGRQSAHRHTPTAGA